MLLSELLELIRTSEIVVVVGPAQVGKTTLAKHVAEVIGRPSLYLDMENPRDEAKLADPVLFFELHQNECVILDEIQLRKDLFPILRSVIDSHRIPGRFVLLGSGSPDLIRNASESLAGRVRYLELTPFSLAETGFDSLCEHWLRGGFPDSFLSKSDKVSMQWRRSFIATYIQRDLPMLNPGISPDRMGRLWKMLGHLSGQLTNYETLSGSLGISGPTVRSHIEFLKEAYLIRLLMPFHTNVKKRLVKSPKLYIRDSGMLHETWGMTTYDELIGHPGCGHSWEGYVIEQIAGRIPEGYDIAFYRTHQGAELDLVVLKNDKPLFAVEIKFSSAPQITKGFHIAMEDLSLNRAFVVIPADEHYPIAQGVEVVSLPRMLETLKTLLPDHG